MHPHRAGRDHVEKMCARKVVRVHDIGSERRDAGLVLRIEDANVVVAFDGFGNCSAEEREDRDLMPARLDRPCQLPREQLGTGPHLEAVIGKEDLHRCSDGQSI
jgi:hypothetical protein